MADSTNLKLPYIAAAQAQKHVTHNEAIRALDAIVQLSVKDRDLTTPPGSPAEGDRYIVAAAATGSWTGHGGKIAAFQDGVWMFYAPIEGWLAWVEDENLLLAWTGTAWVEAITATGLSNLPKLGINATADTTNRLTVAAAATLLNHDGAGHQIKVNKAAAGDTASLLFQSAFSGRAEMGTTGDDDFHVKVSPDGTVWHEALTLDRTSGAVAHKPGARASFGHDATLPGIRIVPAADDPATLLDGDLWYNATTGKFRKREGGVTSDLDSGGGTASGAVVLSANVSNSAVTYANVTGMNFSADADSTYVVDLIGAIQSAAITTGYGFALDIPAGAQVIGSLLGLTSATAATALEQIADDTATGVTTGVRAASTNTPFQARFVVKISSTAGTVQLRFRSEIAASAVTVQAGLTVMQWAKIL